MSLADVETLLQNASASVASGDWEAARRFVLRAKILLGGIPDAGTGSSRYGFSGRVAELDVAIRELRRESTSALGVQTTKVTWATTTD